MFFFEKKNQKTFTNLDLVQRGITGDVTMQPGDITQAWLTARLRQAGAITDSSVTSFTQAPIGNGLVGTSIRYELNYDTPEPAAPASVVAKLPSADATSLHAAASMRLYLRETSFYRHIAPHVAIHTPRVFANHFDPATHDFHLLLEDLTPARGGDQLFGCALEDAATALAEIAALHAPRWGDPALDDLEYLGLPAPVASHIAQLVAPTAEAFRERYSGELEKEVMAAVLRLVPLAEAIMLDTPPQRTVLHGDFRLDNVLFDPKSGAWPMATLDWQTLGRGCGTLDASYFLGAGLRSWDRTDHEQALLRGYHEALLARGVTTYPWAQCWQDYRKHSVNGLFMAMFSAIAVARTDRGDDMFLTMARRHAQQAIELGAFALWA